MVSKQSSQFESESEFSDDSSYYFPGGISTPKGIIKRQQYVRTKFNSATYSEEKYSDCKANFEIQKKLTPTEQLQAKNFSNLGLSHKNVFRISNLSSEQKLLLAQNNQITTQQYKMLQIEKKSKKSSSMREKIYLVNKTNDNHQTTQYVKQTYGEFSTIMSLPQEQVFTSKTKVPMQQVRCLMSLQTIISYSHFMFSNQHRLADILVPSWDRIPHNEALNGQDDIKFIVIKDIFSILTEENLTSKFTEMTNLFSEGDKTE